MEFKKFNELLQENFKTITKEVSNLFEVEVDKDEMWNLYLDSFPKGSNDIYRERREHDCSCCRSFIKSIGNAVIINDNEIKTIWDFDAKSEIYQPVIDALSNYIKSKLVSDVYVTKFKRIGTASSHEKLDNGSVITWNHFFLDIPATFVDKSSRSEGDIKGQYRDIRNVFKRSLDEITEDSVLTVLELINSNTLYKGTEWKAQLDSFLKYKINYSKLATSEEKENYAWEQSLKAGAIIGKIRNHSIGTLLVNVSEGMELDTAVKKYESIVAPANYKRPKAIFTQKMLDDAKKTIQELGYMESLSRRHSKLDDITVNNILFANKDSAKRIIGNDIFDDMKADIAVNPKKFSKIEEISVDNFIRTVVPSTEEFEVLLENKHSNNMVSLISPENKESKNMFKWKNNFSWAYKGNMTDSTMKDNVKSAGGNVDGVLRFSIQWNDIEKDKNDLDAHCTEPNGFEIYYAQSTNRTTKGTLDVDIQNPRDGIAAVENITWSDKSKMQEGTYKFFVHNYAHRGGRNGFRAEIEFDGQIYAFDYNKDVRDRERIFVADVVFSKEKGFSINEKLPSAMASRELWGLKTQQFVPVSTIMFSPNYWDEQEGIGHKHYFFMLKDCINPESPNGFYNEFLKEDLMKHKRVFEALGAKMKVADVDDQLSGVGFSSTKRNELIIKAIGKTERVMKVKF